MIVKMSTRAKLDYYSTLDYLLDEWPLEVVQSFSKNVKALEGLLGVYPRIFKKSAYRNVHVVPVVRQVSMYYYVDEVNQTIWILRFWNTFQDPASFKLE